MRFPRILFLIFTALLIVFSCKKNKDSAVGLNTATCDTSKVSYETCVKPIFEKYCVSCHTSGNISGGLILDVYKEAKPAGVNGIIWGAVEHLDGYSGMPINTTGEKLDSADLLTIRLWCKQGCLP